MARTRGDIIINETGLASSKTYDILLDYLPKVAVQATYTISSPSANVFDPLDVNIVQDTITIANHGYSKGLKGQFTTTGTLPSGISAVTDYFIIKINDSTIQVAASLSDAEAGNEIMLNDGGLGTHTFTPTAYTGAAIGLQSSNDMQNFVDLPSCQVTIETDGVSMFNVVEPSYRWLRFKYVPDSGAIDLTVLLNGYDSLSGRDGTGHH